MDEKECPVNAFVRIKPQPANDQRSCLTTRDTSIFLDQEGKMPRQFTFDWVADQEATQEDIFRRVGQPLLEACLEGYNGTIFAYGQTGSGKTYTLQGGLDTEKGLMPRIFDFLFDHVARKKIEDCGKSEFTITCSYLELYNEHIIDLLGPPPMRTEDKLLASLKIEERRGQTNVEKLLKFPVTTAAEAYKFLNQGSNGRHVGSTLANATSSRSHAVFTLYITNNFVEGGQRKVKSSRLHLIDLAGSENQKLTQTAGTQLQEASSINKALLNLGKVIRALVKANGSDTHVSYRDSKLTLLLKDSLGGNSKTSIIATVSAQPQFQNETALTLTFAQNAKFIKNRAVINQTSASVTDLKKELQRVQSELIFYRQRHANSVLASEEAEIFGPSFAKVQELEQTRDKLNIKIEKLLELIAKHEAVGQSKNLIIKLQANRIERISKGLEHPNERVQELEAELAALKQWNENHPGVINMAIENEDLRDLLDGYRRMCGEELVEPAEVICLRQEIATREAKHSATIEDLQRQLTAALASNDALQTTLKSKPTNTQDEEYKRQCETLEKDNQTLEKNNQTLEKNNQILKESLRLKEDNYEELRLRLETLSKENAKLLQINEGSVNETNDQKKQLESRCHSLENELKESQIALAQSQIAVAKITAEMQSKFNSLEEKTTQHQETLKTLNEATRTINQKNAEILGLDERLKAQSATIEEKQAKIQEMQNQFKKSIKQYKRLALHVAERDRINLTEKESQTQIIQNLEATIAQSKIALENAVQDATKYQNLYETTKSEKEYLTNQMKEDFANQKKELSDSFTEQIEILATKMTEIRGQHDALASKCIALETTIAEKTLIETNLRKEIEAINTSKIASSLQEEKSAHQLKLELTQATAELTTANSNLAKMQKSNTFLRDDKKKAEEQIKKLETEMQSILSNPKRKIQHTMQIKIQNNTLQQEVADLNNQIRKLTIEKKLLESRKAARPLTPPPCEHCLKMSGAGLAEKNHAPIGNKENR